MNKRFFLSRDERQEFNPVNTICKAVVLVE
jgi:hypothetical protein